MELRALQCPAIRGTQPFIHTGLRESPFFSGNSIKILRPKNNRNAGKLHLLNTTVWASPSSGAKKVVVKAAIEDGGVKDEGLVFVAGSTGKVGSRTVRELLKLGFRVKSGVRSVQRAESLVQSVKEMKLDDGTQSIEKLEIVECDLEKRDKIEPALGKASVVICCIGASEKEISDITGPYRIDYQATKNLIDAAKSAKVNHFILVTSLGTNKFGFPAAILNLFWGVLIWKRKAEEALLASGLPYTIVRPGGMERPTDDYKKTHNMTSSEQDTLFGGQVSNLQIAELLAFMAQNRSLSYCKVVEVIAETTAPLTPMNKLLEKITSDRVEVEVKVKSVKEAETDIPPQSTRYDDLKPPSSPSPSSPPILPKDTKIEEIVSSSPPIDETILVEETSPTIDEMKVVEETSQTINSNTVVVEVQTLSWPLSPYTAYEDLKPPSSPTPIASGPKQPPSNDSAKSEAETNLPGVIESSKDSNSDESSSTVTFSFETPSNVPEKSEAEPVLLGDNDSLKDSNSDESPTTLYTVETLGNNTPQPLSPYAMYENLKPPSSPTPLHS